MSIAVAMRQKLMNAREWFTSGRAAYPQIIGAEPKAVSSEAAELFPDKKLLTARGEADKHIDIPDGLRNVFAVWDDGTFYVHRPEIHNAAVLTLANEIAKLYRITLSHPEPVDHDLIRNAYGNHAIQRISSAAGVRDRLINMINRAANMRTEDIQIQLSRNVAIAKFQLDGFLTAQAEEFVEEDAIGLFTSAFYYCDVSPSVENENEIQVGSVVDASKLPSNVYCLRMHFSRSDDGRHLNIRLIYRDLPTKGNGLAQLALPRRNIQDLHTIQMMAAGLFTVSAPTGHGKTTTLTIFLGDLSDSRDNRITIVSADDPPEGTDPRITYFPVKDRGDGEDGYVEAMKASLRVNPHVVRVGECRTATAATMSFDAANTGKLVVTTTHTDEALTIPSRYEEIGVPRNVAYSLKRHVGWMSQRLIPKLCPDCRVLLKDAAPADDRRRALYRHFKEVLGPVIVNDLYVRGHVGPDGKPCKSCSGKDGRMPGIKGRKLIAETVIPTAQLIAKLRDSYEDARTFWLRDMKGWSLRLAGLLDLASGVIGVDEYMTTVANPQDLAFDLRLVVDQYSNGVPPSTAKELVALLLRIRDGEDVIDEPHEHGSLDVEHPQSGDSEAVHPVHEYTSQLTQVAVATQQSPEVRHTVDPEPADGLDLMVAALTAAAEAQAPELTYPKPQAVQSPSQQTFAHVQHRALSADDGELER